MSERRSRTLAFVKNRERGQEPSLATATKKGVPSEAPARRAESGKS